MYVHYSSIWQPLSVILWLYIIISAVIGKIILYGCLEYKINPVKFYKEFDLKWWYIKILAVVLFPAWIFSILYGYLMKAIAWCIDSYYERKNKNGKA